LINSETNFGYRSLFRRLNIALVCGNPLSSTVVT
jgi:hypothetical protein